MASMEMATTAKNAEHHLRQAVLFLGDLEDFELPHGYDGLTVRLVKDLTDGGAEYIGKLVEAASDGT